MFKDFKKVDEFVNEQIAWDNISSPFVVKRHEVIKTKHSVYTVMEYCNGLSLDRLLEHRKFLTEAETRHIVK